MFRFLATITLAVVAWGWPQDAGAQAAFDPAAFRLVDLPMKIEGSSGGPIRAVAAVPAPGRAARAAALPLIVSPELLAGHLSQPGLVVIHVGDRDGYERGHIPGARQLWLDAISEPGSALRLQMPAVSALHETFEQLGVSDTTHIVLYFGKDQVTATARTFVTLDYLGLGDRVSLLDGGLPAWQAAGQAVSTEVPATVRGRLTPRPRPEAVADASWVADHRLMPGVAVVDARTPGFYTGQENPSRRYARPGHIGGAHSVPFSALVTETGRFRSEAELSALFREAGVQPGDTVVSYCHIGQQASLVYVVARLLGHDARLYDGSYEEWSARPELPVESGVRP